MPDMGGQCGIFMGWFLFSGFANYRSSVMGGTEIIQKEEKQVLCQNRLKNKQL